MCIVKSCNLILVRKVFENIQTIMVPKMQNGHREIITTIVCIFRVDTFISYINPRGPKLVGRADEAPDWPDQSKDYTQGLD